METTFEFVKLRPAPGTQARRATDWKVMSNETIKFALDLASLHDSPYEVEILTEIDRRIDAGTWLDIDSPVPTMAAEVPRIFYYWPFCLLWSQRPR